MVNLVYQNFIENKELYNKIENEFRKDLGEDIPINHVGSTAIPNMVGKNIIDILVGASDEKMFKQLTEYFVQKGYRASEKSRTDIYRFLASKEGETSSGDIHIHLVRIGTERYNEFIILRDYLLNNKEEATEYSNLKKKLIESGIVERKEYKNKKSEYVTKLIERAKEWYENKDVITMKLRLANNNDLDFLKEMYKGIIENMYQNNIKIWNDFYPYEVIKEDVENSRFYVLENDKEIVAACALCNSNSGEDSVKWNEGTKDVFYMDRLGVNKNYLRQGIGGLLIEKIKDFAKQECKKYIRLFVVDSNIPAVNMYLKNGFKKVDGIYEEKINDEVTLIEYGMEIKL